MNKKDSNNSAAAAANVSILTDAVAEFNCSKCDCLIDVRGLSPFTQIECPKCSAKEFVPARLGNFLLLKLLGTGGMGGVYYARDETLGRFVAIKVMLQKLGNNPEFIETFRREARAVAKLNHPNIAQIYSFGQEKGQPYIVMELVNGEHVDEMMEEPGGIPIPLAIKICLEAAQGLSAADEAGIVHGDIKPENIMLDKNGRAKLVDFGLATVAHAAAEEGIWGTPYYIAPEKLKRQKVDARADIYSLGASLYHILAGKPPFDGETPVEVVKARLEQPPPDLREVRDDIPDIVANVVTRMLATERSARYPTYKSLIGDLRKALHEVGEAPAKTGRFSGKQIRFKQKKKNKKPSKVADIKRTASITQDSAKFGAKKKIVIHKDKSHSSFRIKTSGDGKSNGSSTIKAAAVNTIKDHTPPPKPPMSIKKIFAIIFSILGLLIVGGITTIIVIHHKEAVEKRVEYFALEEARKNSLNMQKTLTKQAEKVGGYIEKLKGCEEFAKESVLLITDAEYTSGNAAVPAAEATGTNAVTAADAKQDETDSKEVAEKTDGQSQTDAVAEKAGTEAAAATNSVAAATNNLAAATNSVATATNKPSAAVAEEAPEDQESSNLDLDDDLLTITKTRDKSLPPITAATRDVIENLKKLKTISKHLEAAKLLAAQTVDANSHKISSKSAKANNAILRKQYKNAAAYFESAQNIYKYIKETNEKIIKLSSARRDEIARQKKAEERAALLQAEEERKQREREEHEALVKTELEQVKFAAVNQHENFIQNEYDLSVKQLTDTLKDYKTDEGRDAIKRIIARYKALSTMRKDLIDSINEKAFSWGWGSGASARDIVKASEQGITLNDSTAIYPWKAVNIPQMLKIVDHYIDAREPLNSTKKYLSLGAAVYCDEHSELIGNVDDDKTKKKKKRAKDKARAYLNKSIGFGLRQSVADKLLGEDY